MSDLDQTIKVAVSGCGLRSQAVIKRLLLDSRGQVEVATVFDPDRQVVSNALSKWEITSCNICSSYEEAIHTPQVDWVMIFSPNNCHCQQILAAFEAKKHVFSEKPLATTIEDCKLIYDAHQKSSSIFATGFVLRYSRLYRLAKELLDSGKLGRILSINADENIPPPHGAYIMQNWRRHTSIAGPHILEKCCHDLDLLNWFCGSLPDKVAAFGSLDFFRKENQSLKQKHPGVFDSCWSDPHSSEADAFASDKDIIDNQVCIARYRNGIKVQFQATMSNVIPERRMYFSCTEGTMLLDLYKSTLCYRLAGNKEIHTVDFAADGHGGGDDNIMSELFDVMQHGGEPKCSGSEGLESAVFALALDQAMRENQVIDLEPVWRHLNR